MKKTHARRWAILLWAIWVVVAALSINRYLYSERQHTQFNLLSNQLEEFRHALSSPETIRAQQLDQLSLSMQLIRSLRLQLEADYEGGFLTTDLTHFFYVADRYLERAQAYIQLRSNLGSLALELAEIQNDPAMPDEVRVYYNELSAYLFGALFAEDIDQPINYRILEQLLDKSYQLEPEYRSELQDMLSQVSIVLAEHAQIGFLTSGLLSHSLVKEISIVVQQSHDIQWRLVFIAAVFGVVAMLGLTLLVFRTVGDEQETLQAKELNNTLEESEETLPNFVESPNDQREESKSASPSDEPNMQQAVIPIESKEIAETDIQSSETKPAVKKTSSSSDFDLEYMLDTFEQDKDSVDMVLSIFLQDHKDDVNRFKQQLEDDLEKATRTVHSLKGIAGSLGASELKEISLTIEKKLKHGESVSADEVASFESILLAVIDSVEAHLSTT
ncbi:Hpt domain-containing protein [Vibrio sp. SCSIO 43136]|uniref:Hpt domain-containing protein n=1 Tax=Vibrio sp. SCSIO 43136 TaxID=2819101 RepID=UPI002074C24E|nr:Hpt domain-containing protein [Vibrio sp. SCSIO 43136]USD66075.1 Hpt domain-containing protein [Vibrio sp. SCSIO 43136]